MDKLKPCPFCGSEPKTNVYYAPWENGYNKLSLVAQVKCDNCDTSQSACFKGEHTNFDEYINTFNTAIKKWNTRI